MPPEDVTAQDAAPSAYPDSDCTYHSILAHDSGQRHNLRQPVRACGSGTVGVQYALGSTEEVQPRLPP
jgi:hypothetical protein